MKSAKALAPPTVAIDHTTNLGIKPSGGGVWGKPWLTLCLADAAEQTRRRTLVVLPRRPGDARGLGFAATFVARIYQEAKAPLHTYCQHGERISA